MAAAVVEIASAAAARCVDAGFGPVADAANRARAIAAMHLFDAADGWSVVAHPRAFPCPTALSPWRAGCGSGRARPRSAPRRKAAAARRPAPGESGSPRSEEHTSELQSLMRISYAVFCLKKKKKYIQTRR